MCWLMCLNSWLLFNTDAPEDHGRKVDKDTMILSKVQSGSSAVYQCNASNEYGYLMANAFVNVLGESSREQKGLEMLFYRPVYVRYSEY